MQKQAHSKGGWGGVGGRWITRVLGGLKVGCGLLIFFTKLLHVHKDVQDIPQDLKYIVNTFQGSIGV